jgi:alpha-glucosidase
MTILAAVLMTMSLNAKPNDYVLASPDGKLQVMVETGEGIHYSLVHDGDLLVGRSEIGMYMTDGSMFGGLEQVKKASTRGVNQTIKAILYKKAEIKDEFNELTLRFAEFSLIFRVYDDGMAYRFVSHKEDPYNVDYETAEFNFAKDWNMWAAYVSQHTESLESQYYNSFENTYSFTPISSWNKERLAFLPLMVEGPRGKKIVVTESDLIDYPGMYLYNEKGDKNLSARFAPYPNEVKQGGHNNLQLEVQSRQPYIAKCVGNDKFPWRIIAVSEDDIQMADNDMVYRLARPADTALGWGWVKPGKVAWDWWNDWNISGVDFKSGINTETYQHYIDFASENGIQYVILDEGWAVNGEADLFQVVPEIHLEKLVKYAAERNVGIILWAGYWAFDRDMEKVCKHYSNMGIKGFKVDFMDRDDQHMVQFHQRAAITAAKYKLMLDFHGTYKPAGLNRTYPNVINFEGVHGLETMKWSDASVDQGTYDVTVPYIRMMAGPVDYTQGAMRNATRSNYHPVYNEPMSQGTRCRQLAQYVVFESPLNMLCDSPSSYVKEKECLEFMAEIPTVWDETRGLCGEVGKYIALARRSGEDWYVGGMTDWNNRTLTLDLSFLPQGVYSVELYRDGVNADRRASDYKKEVFDLPLNGLLKVNMAPGGGFAAKIVKK